MKQIYFSLSLIASISLSACKWDQPNTLGLDKAPQAKADVPQDQCRSDSCATLTLEETVSLPEREEVIEEGIRSWFVYGVDFLGAAKVNFGVIDLFLTPEVLGDTPKRVTDGAGPELVAGDCQKEMNPGKFSPHTHKFVNNMTKLQYVGSGNLDQPLNFVSEVGDTYEIRYEIAHVDQIVGECDHLPMKVWIQVGQP